MTIMLSNAAMLVIVCAVGTFAQNTQATVSLVGGSATNVLGATSRAITVAPSVSIVPDARVAFGLEAAGTTFDNRQWSAAVGASADTRLAMGRHAALALHAAGNATGTSYDFSYTTANVLPSLEITAGALSGYAGTRLASATTRGVRSIEHPFGLLGLPTPTERSDFALTRGARALVYGANARFAGTGETVVLGVREERGRVDTVATVDRSASASLFLDRVTLGANLGVRREPQSTATFGTGSVSVAMTRAVSLELNAGAYPASRLVGTPSGRFINVGLSLRARRFGAVEYVPRVEGVAAPVPGATRLVLRDVRATRVEVLGDFTNWKPVGATRAPGGGAWFVDLRIPPGRYRYAFRVDGATWRIPDGAAAVDDDFGGKSALLEVKASPSGSVR
jgi:hypothetical protein